MPVIQPKRPLRYEPERWNGLPQEWDIRCYTHALDFPEIGYVCFGDFARAAGDVPETVTSFEFPYLLKDNWLVIRQHECDPHKEHVIAVFANQAGRVKHVARLNEGKIWSHKPGTHPVTNRDINGVLMEDIEKAAMPLDWRLVCYLKMGPGGILCPDEWVNTMPNPQP